MTLLIRNQNVRGRKALKKGQSLILCTVRNVSGQRYATSYIVSVIMDLYSWLAAFELRTFDQIARTPPLWYITKSKASPWPC